MKGLCMAAGLAATTLSLVMPASAAIIVITQAKANAGGVTPGDTPGFPVSLSQPGAYRLDTNLTVPAGKQGISVRSNYVDIDMNGFLLSGWNAAGTARAGNYGVYSSFGVGSIRNGVITGFKFDGIFLTGNSNSWTVEDMTIQSNGGVGINAEVSAYSRIVDSTISINGAFGIVCGSYCHIEGNNISDNGHNGISLESGTVLGNTIFSNIGYGIYDTGSQTDTGFGNNTIIDNNASDPSGLQVLFVIPLQPNACQPAAC